MMWLDDGGLAAGVADKLVLGRQLIQVITFLPSGIGPSKQPTKQAEQCAVGDLEEQGHRLRLGAAPLMWDAD